jgi:hypothetical protein
MDEVVRKRGIDPGGEVRPMHRVGNPGTAGGIGDLKIGVDDFSIIGGRFQEFFESASRTYRHRYDNIRVAYHQPVSA